MTSIGLYMIQARSDVGVEWLETLGPEVLRGPFRSTSRPTSPRGLSSLLCKRPSFLGVAVAVVDGLQRKGQFPFTCVHVERAEVRAFSTSGRQERPGLSW